MSVKIEVDGCVIEAPYKNEEGHWCDGIRVQITKNGSVVESVIHWAAMSAFVREAIKRGRVDLIGLPEYPKSECDLVQVPPKGPGQSGYDEQQAWEIVKLIVENPRALDVLAKHVLAVKVP